MGSGMAQRLCSASGLCWLTRFKGRQSDPPEPLLERILHQSLPNGLGELGRSCPSRLEALQPEDLRPPDIRILNATFADEPCPHFSALRQRLAGAVATGRERLDPHEVFPLPARVIAQSLITFSGLLLALMHACPGINPSPISGGQYGHPAARRRRRPVPQDSWDRQHCCCPIWLGCWPHWQRSR